MCAKVSDPWPAHGVKLFMSVVAFFLLALAPARALTSEDLAFNQGVRRAAVDLVRSDRASEVTAYLSGNLRTSSVPLERSIEIAQCLLEITGQFYNERKMPLARQAGAQAAAVVAQLVAQNPANPSCADLSNNLGLICEAVFFDLVAAQRYYESALSIQPGHPGAKTRLQAVKEKLRIRGTRN